MKSIEAAIVDSAISNRALQVDAAVTQLRLVGIEFDTKTLRVIAEAEGAVKVGSAACRGNRGTCPGRSAV